ncbi:ATP-binding protein [Streptomyces sp. TLI_146]|uniref:ATP-binding protein n=1 Tax=Streptomyces sp. TLI_146 TaxID=1938858 RepID=UPI000C70B45D|nr:ATP-binding protein [Streptomyces sp. TLI_146]PKV86861.1 anti-sigma regulatory factor (Ser/Thr protein kinase) [Streptomyces sp. TLI_146]
MDEYMSGPPGVWGLICPGSPEEVARARRWTRDVLREHPRGDDAVLVVSELGTNALTHTAGHVLRVMLTVTEGRVTVAVTDSGGAPDGPKVTEAPEEAVHGRGLNIVMALANRLSVTGDEAGRTVTAELPC